MSPVIDNDPEFWKILKTPPESEWDRVKREISDSLTKEEWAEIDNQMLADLEIFMGRKI
jgi:hypothetical protein